MKTFKNNKHKRYESTQEDSAADIIIQFVEEIPLSGLSVGDNEKLNRALSKVRTQAKNKDIVLDDDEFDVIHKNLKNYQPADYEDRCEAMRQDFDNATDVL